MNLRELYRDGTTAYMLTHGFLGNPVAKTAHGVLDYGEIFSIVAVIDAAKADCCVGEVMPRLKRAKDTPIYKSFQEAYKRKKADVLILGVAAPGGQIPESWMQDIRDALAAGVDLITGMHTFFSDDLALTALAERSGSRIIDLRKPPEDLSVAHQLVRKTAAKVVLCLGTDCVVGKRTATAALFQQARTLGQKAAFLATGQTGLLLGCDDGVVIDRIPADFVAGQLEKMVLQLHKQGKAYIYVEGQGALLHPAYGGVTLSLLHGADPQAVILVHDPERLVREAFGDPNMKVASWQKERDLIESLSRAKVVALVTWGPKKKQLLNDADLPVFDLTVDEEKVNLLQVLDRFWAARDDD